MFVATFVIFTAFTKLIFLISKKDQITKETNDFSQLAKPLE